MIITSKPWLKLITASVLSAAVQSHAWAEAIYVKIQDLSPQGSPAFQGADIDAVEIAPPNGYIRYFASRVVETDVADYANKAELDPDYMLGAPVILESGLPYVYSLNGGSVTLAINAHGQKIDNNWRISVYEVDGTLYESGAPDPYEVFVSNKANGPWRSLGMGSGIARFTLDGKRTPEFTEAELKEVRDIITEPDSTPMPDFLRQIIDGEKARIATVNSLDQIKAELAGYLIYYRHLHHEVVDHGGEGNLAAPQEVLTALVKRLDELKR